MAGDFVVTERLLSSASYVFAADNNIAASPMLRPVAKKLESEFGFRAVAIQVGEPVVWAAHVATLEFSPTRVVAVQDVLGSVHELTTTVEGTTQDAIDVLEEVWTKLVTFNGTEPRSLRSNPGELMFNTASTVRLRATWSDLAPALVNADDFIRKRLGSTVLGPTDLPNYKLEIPFQLRARGILVSRSFVLERRRTATAEDRVYWVQSPLRSDDHEQLVRSLAPSL